MSDRCLHWVRAWVCSPMSFAWLSSASASSSAFVSNFVYNWSCFSAELSSKSISCLLKAALFSSIRSSSSLTFYLSDSDVLVKSLMVAFWCSSDSCSSEFWSVSCVNYSSYFNNSLSFSIISSSISANFFCNLAKTSGDAVELGVGALSRLY